MRKIFAVALFTCIAITACDDQSKTETSVTDTDSTAMADGSNDMNTAPVDSATMMTNWMAYMQPTAPHDMMKNWDGAWEEEITMWHVPGAPPEVSKASCVNKMIMGGRYQESTTKGNMMGQPFEGMSTTAYDNAKKVFVTTWIDNMGTGMMVLEGPWDEATKTMTLTGNVVDPTAGTGKEMKVRQLYKVIDNNNHLMEMYGPGPDGNEFKMMEIKFARK